MLTLVFTARERERQRIERLEAQRDRARKSGQSEKAAHFDKQVRLHDHWAMLDARWEPGPSPESITGRNSTAVLNQWNALPNWAELDPQQFRARLCWYFGISHILPSIDAEILEFVINAAPTSLRLEGEEEEPTDAEAAAWPSIS